KELYEDENQVGKSKAMKDLFVVLFKIFISTMVPRSGELFFQTKLVKILRRFYPNLVVEERAQKLDASFLTRMGIKEKVVKPLNPLQIRYEEHLYCKGFPVISEAYDEEVIQFFLEGLKRDTGVNVPRDMVRPAPIVDLYKPKKRKRVVKVSEKEEGRKKEKVEDKKKEKVEQKKEEKEEKKKDVKLIEKKEVSRKRKAEGIKIDEAEARSKKRHEKKASKDDSMTVSDDRTLAQRMKQRTSEETFKKHFKNISK
ncbi:hypothetical protein A2U01_0025999, partial [Trifolium medium]|nr:hypothetical protein [Trifolium medium]